MPDEPMCSHSTRGEDVVLRRAFSGYATTVVATIGWDDSTRSLTDAGWQLSPDASHEVQVLLIGSDRVRESALDLSVLRPWVCLAPGRADSPEGSDLAGAGYRPVRFDGASTWWLRPDHEHLAALLDHEAQPGEFVSVGTLELRAERDDWRTRALDGWATETASELHAGRAGGAEEIARELSSMRSTLSWRITAPLRAVRRYLPVR